jgi:hypothetical protein
VQHNVTRDGSPSYTGFCFFSLSDTDEQGSNDFCADIQCHMQADDFLQHIVSNKMDM